MAMTELVAVALITAGASLGATALLPWVREWVSSTSQRRREHQDRRHALAAEAIDVAVAASVQRAKNLAGAFDAVEFSEHIGREGRVMWAVQAFDARYGDALGGLLGTAFILARESDDRDSLGALMVALAPWSHGQINGQDAFEKFCEELDLPSPDSDDLFDAVQARIKSQ